ncbi:hypothetical protein ACFQU2_31770 [Siccirubricoccus deserti]
MRATEALIAQTRLQVEFATITAEIDGRLGALPLRVGISSARRRAPPSPP